MKERSTNLKDFREEKKRKIINIKNCGNSGNNMYYYYVFLERHKGGVTQSTFGILYDQYLICFVCSRY